jgi:predicted PurR-regulated permease PerM
VPFLGGILAFTLALLVALSSHGLLYAVVATAVVFAAAELFEGHVLMPRILGESLGLSDVTVIFAITAGGASLGLLGVLLALPLAAVIKVLYIEFVQPALEQFADEQSELHLG